MKLQKINEMLEIGGTSLGVRFMSPPVALPIKGDGTVCKIDETFDGKMHYASIVFVEDTQKVGLFEYNSEVYNALSGYARRYNMSEIEILISRLDTGMLNLTIGRNYGLPSLDVVSKSCEKLQEYLTDKYLSKANLYKVHDI